MDIRKVELMKSLNREYYAELRRRKTASKVVVNGHVWFVAKLCISFTVVVFTLVVMDALLF